VSVILVAVSLLLAGFAELTSDLTCRRVGSVWIDCTLARSIAGIELSRGEVRGLSGAQLGKGGVRTYRVDLDVQSGPASLTVAA
jgi:hypothetical protein